MDRAVLLVVLVLLAQYGYKLPALFGEPSLSYVTLTNGAVVKERSWLYYIFQAVQDFGLWWMLLDTFRNARFSVWALGVCACAVGVSQSFETAACGAAALGHNFTVPFGDRLCIAEYGPLLGPALALTVIALMVIVKRKPA